MQMGMHCKKLDSASRSMRGNRLAHAGFESKVVAMPHPLALVVAALVSAVDPIIGSTTRPVTQVPGVTDSPLSRPPFHAVAGELEFSGQLIVRPKQTLSARERTRALAMIAPQIERVHSTTDEFILAGDATPEKLGVFENRRSAQLLATGLFQYAHPNWIVFPVYEPNDARLNEQWHHTMMHSREAWSISSGSPDVIVAVTDTGIVAHEDLTHRVSGYNAVSLVAEVDGGDLTDIHGHGTHVAGCAAATGDNGVGVAGSGWSLSVMPIRVSEAANGGASFDSLLGGSRWAIEHGAKVTSASYSGIGYEAVETTGAYIHSLDGSLLWAAGNSSTNHSSWDFDNVLVIGASDPADGRAWFSSYGRGVDLFSPGVSILSSTKDGGYQSWNGTSMATPVANGALGVIRSTNTDLSAQHAEYILMHSCDIWPGGSNSTEWGFGRINLQTAVTQALAAMSPQPPVARDDFARSYVGATVNIDALSNDYDANMDALVIDWSASSSSLGDAVEIVPASGAQVRDLIRITTTTSAAGGERTIAYRLREPISGATSNAIITVTLDAQLVPSNPVGEMPGLDCHYYEIGALSALPDWSTLTPYLQEIVPQVDIASTGDVFANSGRADQVGAVYDGWLLIPQADLWTLSITSDDGSRLSIGNEMVINNDGLHGMQTASASFAFAAGMYPIRLEFFENGGGAGFIFNWSGSGIASQAIPPQYLFHGGSISLADFNRDGLVDATDLAALLGAWGTNNPIFDINQDGLVDATDLSMLLVAWGE